MKRTCFAVVLSILLLASGLTPVLAQEDARKLKLDTRKPIASYVREDGLGVTVFELDDALLDAVKVRRGGKSAFAYIAYTSIGKPSLIGGIDAFDLMPLEFTPYYYALAVANLGTGSHRGSVTLRLRGPKAWTENFSGVSIQGRTITVLWWKAPALNRVGNYLFKGVMTGAGAARSRFCAGC